MGVGLGEILIVALVVLVVFILVALTMRMSGRSR